MNSNHRRNSVIFWAVVITALVIIAFLPPNECGFYPKCPTKTLLGLDCAFCGGLRAVHFILQGDFVGGVKMNPGVVMLPIILLIALIATFSARLRSKILSIKALYIGMLLFVLLSVVRNI